MMTLLEVLEPRYEAEGTILYNELDDLQEIIFHQKGLIDIGFIVNRKARFVLRMHKGTILGAYNCTEHIKTMFLYKCKSEIEGYMVRKEAWIDILDEFEEISSQMKKNVK